MANTKIPSELVAINAISGTLIADNAITSVHIAQNNITATQIAINAVTALQMADGTITSAKIADGTIVTADIAAGQITTDRLADSAVTTGKIAAGTIVAGDIANNAIHTQHIDDNQITADQIADNAVGIGQLAGIARGKIIVGDSAGNPALLALGAANTLLQSDGTDLVFAPLQSGIDDNSNAVAITIDSSENVGIGTTSPAAKLHVDTPGTTAVSLTGGAAAGQIFTNENFEFAFGLHNASPYPLYIQGRTADSGTTTARDIVLNPLGGKVGIGTTSPLAQLEIDPPAADTAIFAIRRQDHATVPLFKIVQDSSVSQGTGHCHITSSNRDMSITAGENLDKTKGLYIKTTGNVGIGTSSPSSYHSLANNLVIASAGDTGMTIASGTSSDGRIFFADGTSGSAESQGQIRYDHNGDYMAIHTADSERMRIDSSGNAGIGTASPNAYSGQTALTINSSGVARLDLDIGNTIQGYLLAEDGYIGLFSSSGKTLRLGAGAEAIRILANGRVGIGTIAPSANLDIAGGGSSTVPTLELTSATSTAFNHSINAFNPNLTDGEGNLIVVGRAGSTKNAGWLGYRYSSAGSDNNIISLGHWGNNWLLNVKGNGNVGIGTTAPATLLHLKAASGEAELRVEAAANSEARLRFGDATDNDAGYIGYSRANGLLSFSALNSRGVDMKIGSAGTVGINIAPTTGVQLYVDAPVNRHAGLFRNASANYAPIISDNLATSGTRFFVSFRLNNTEVGKITSTGSSTVYATSSDHRLKENIDYTWDATTRLKQLKPARFNWIADATNTLVDGFIAHEAATVVPESVTGEKDAVDVDNNPVMQGIDQSKLVPLLVKTIQELEARITILEG